MKNTKTGLQFRSYINAQTKNTVNRAEYGIAYQTNKNRGFYYSQEALLNIYNALNYDDNGASKMTYLHNKETGEAFKYIVIKRMRPDYIEGCYLRGNNNNNNQVADELKMFLDFEATQNKFLELLNPILRYDTVKSDHNDSEGKKAIEKYIIVSYKAVFIDDFKTCCNKAVELNNKNNMHGESTDTRLQKAIDFSNCYNMEDVLYNPGNSGVIYNPLKNCYEAVFIDYAR